MSVAFRVDAGAVIGSGHVARCQTLADELRRRGARVRFVCREHSGHMSAQLERAGYLVHRLSAPAAPAVSGMHRSWLGATAQQDAQETCAALRGAALDWLIADHYAIDAEWETQLRSVTTRLMAIDDLADRAHDVDVLLDQNYHGDGAAERYRSRLPAGCRTFVGPRHALLQPIYRQLRTMLPMRDGFVRRVLVFFGAHDPSHSASTVMRVLAEAEFAALAVDVVTGNDAAVGAAARELAAMRSGIQVHESLPSLAALMTRADLAVGAAGGATWERACLGLPSLLAIVAENQAPGANALAAGNFIRLAGRAESLDAASWRAALRALLSDRPLLVELARQSYRLTDGFGAARIASALQAAPIAALELRPAKASDEALLLDWANDPGVRSQAFAPAPITPQRHHEWFATHLADANSHIFIGEDSHGLPLGQLRFEIGPARDTAFVHISVESAARGRRVGSALLRAGLAHLAARHRGITVVAEILENNTASQRMFAACGFEPVQPRRSGAVAFEYRIRGEDSA